MKNAKTWNRNITEIPKKTFSILVSCELFNNHVEKYSNIKNNHFEEIIMKIAFGVMAQRTKDPEYFNDYINEVEI